MSITDIIREFKVALIRVLKEKESKSNPLATKYKYKRAISRENLKAILEAIWKLKKEVRKLDFVIAKFTPHIRYFTEALVQDIMNLNYVLTRFIMSLEAIKLEESGETIWIIDWYEVQDEMKNLINIIKVFEQTYNFYFNFYLSSTIRAIVPVGEIARLRERAREDDEEEDPLGDIDIIIAETSEAKQYELAFGLKPPFLIADGTAIPISSFNPRTVKIIVDSLLKQKEKLKFQLSPFNKLKVLSSQFLEALINLNTPQLKKLAIDIRTNMCLAMQFAVKNYLNFFRCEPRFFGFYSIAMEKLGMLIEAKELKDISLRGALMVLFSMADLVAIGELIQKGLADRRGEPKDKIHIITSAYCPHCHQFLEKNEKKLEDPIFEVYELTEFPEYASLVGAYYYTIVYKRSVKDPDTGKVYHPASTNVPYMVYGTIVLDLGADIDIDEVVKLLWRELQGIFPDKKVKAPQIPQMPTIPQIPMMPRINFPAKPLGNPANPTNTQKPQTLMPTQINMPRPMGDGMDDIRQLLINLARMGLSANDISEYLKKQGINASPSKVRQLYKKLFGVGLRELKKTLRGEAEKKEK